LLRIGVEVVDGRAKPGHDAERRSGPIPEMKTMLRLGSVLSFLLLPSLAAAEVCDKVAGEGWWPEHGPVDAPNWWRFLGFVVVSLALIRLLKLRSLAWFGAAFAGLGILFNGLLAIWPDDNEITRAAIREGCLSPHNSLYSFLLATAFAALAAMYMAAATSHILIPKPD
jgi:hypothetical protein